MIVCVSQASPGFITQFPPLSASIYFALTWPAYSSSYHQETRSGGHMSRCIELSVYWSETLANSRDEVQTIICLSQAKVEFFRFHLQKQIHLFSYICLNHVCFYIQSSKYGCFDKIAQVHTYIFINNVFLNTYSREYWSNWCWFIDFKNGFDLFLHMNS